MTSPPTDASPPTRAGGLFGVPPAVRVAFGALEQLAPGPGARWAERIWFTLPPRQATSDTGPVPDGHPFVVDVLDKRVAGQAWGDGPPVYLMHGWAGHLVQMTAFVPPLLAAGYRVVAMDAPSHGASGPGPSGPRSSSLPEFAAALAATVTSHGPAHAVIAHSFGATAAVRAILDGTPVQRLVLLAPMAGPTRYAREFLTALGGGPRIHRHLVARAERRIGAPLADFDLPALGERHPTPPTLIVHDRDDSFVPFDHGTRIATAWTHARLHATSGLGHRRLLGNPDVISEVVQFLD